MIAGDAYVTKQGVYIYPNDEVDIDSLTSFILDNEYRSNKYRKNYDLYTGQHDILRKPHDPQSARPDNRLVSNWLITLSIRMWVTSWGSHQRLA